MQTYDQSEGTSAVPIAMACADIVNSGQGSHRSRFHRPVRVFHFPKPDARAYGILLPQKSKPFLIHVTFLQNS